MVPLTCPWIDHALEEAANRIKEQTTSLRDALNCAVERYLDDEERIEFLQRDLEDLRIALLAREEQIGELQTEIEELESRIEELER